MVYIYSVYYMGSFKEMVGIMTQNKWICFLSFFLLGSVCVNAQVLAAELDVIIRDFEVTHPDFENFTEYQSNIIYGTDVATQPNELSVTNAAAIQGYLTDGYWMTKSLRPSNQK